MRNPRFDPLDDFACVLTGSHDHGAAHHLPAVDVEGAASEIPADLDRRNLTKIDRRSVALGQDNVFQISDGVGGSNQSETAHDKLHAVFLDDLAAHVQIAFANGLHHVLQRHPGGAHLGGGNLDLILPDEPAHAADLGDALDGVELIAHKPILHPAQLAQVIATLRRGGGIDVEVILINPAQAGGVGSQLRRDSGRQDVAEIIQPLQDARAGKVVVDLVLENDRDDREPEH